MYPFICTLYSEANLVTKWTTLRMRLATESNATCPSRYNHDKRSSKQCTCTFYRGKVIIGQHKLILFSNGSCKKSTYMNATLQNEIKIMRHLYMLIINCTSCIKTTTDDKTICFVAQVFRKKTRGTC